MSQNYEPEFKHKIIRLHLEEGRTIASLAKEYSVSKSAISIWCKNYTEECQEQAQNDPNVQNELELMQENRRLRKELV